jgi:hypothetical protein
VDDVAAPALGERERHSVAVGSARRAFDDLFK